jgi:hypothetical protein
MNEILLPQRPALEQKKQASKREVVIFRTGLYPAGRKTVSMADSSSLALILSRQGRSCSQLVRKQRAHGMED